MSLLLFLPIYYSCLSPHPKALPILPLRGYVQDGNTSKIAQIIALMVCESPLAMMHFSLTQSPTKWGYERHAQKL